MLNLISKHATVAPFPAKRTVCQFGAVLEPKWFQLGASLHFHRPRAKSSQRHDNSIKQDHVTICLEVDRAGVCDACLSNSALTLYVLPNVHDNSETRLI